MDVIEKKNNSQTIADYLLSQIIDGSLKLGDKLPTERGLAEELGVSRVSVREALSALTVMGVLESRQGSGTYVAGNSSRIIGHVMYANAVLTNHSTIGDIMVVKRALEAECARYAARYRTQKDLERLHTAVEDYGKALPEDDNALVSLEQMQKFDNRIHDTIVHASRQDYLIQVFQTISSSFEESREQELKEKMLQARLSRRFHYQHQQIMMAIEEQDEEFAFRSMYVHLKSVGEFYL